MDTNLICVVLCLAICLIYIHAEEYGINCTDCHPRECEICEKNAPPGSQVICRKFGACRFACRYGIGIDKHHNSPFGIPCRVNGVRGKCDGRGNCKPNRSAATAIRCE